MYSCGHSRSRLWLLCATLATLTACVSTPPRPVTSSGLDGGRPLSLDALSPVDAGYYRVNPGDTLTGIASAYGHTPVAVARWNEMSVTDPVAVGQVLRVAPPAGAASKAVASAKPNPAMASATVALSPETRRLKWPVPGPVNTKFVAGSKGIELGGHVGAPVKAADAGRVVYAGETIKAYGRLVIIKHDDHFVTAYGNNARLLVKDGAVITQGQTIAAMGADANGNGSLKFEVRKDGKPVDPLTYLPRRPS